MKYQDAEIISFCFVYKILKQLRYLLPTKNFEIQFLEMLTIYLSSEQKKMIS